ncbi:MAG TPA: ADOP family duplicated permease [Gemmatimonadaceae bacterium]|nr:ADOP family duplicated permease [Gemmatimonadaceae bacterium]
MRELVSDIRYACRALLKSRGYTTTVLVSLALGIGASTLVFTIIDASVFRALPYARPHELVELMATDGVECDTRCADLFTREQLREVQERVRSFSQIAAFTQGERLLTGSSSASHVGTAAVGGRFFRILGVPAVRGRVLDERDATPGSAPAVVLSHALWRQRFGSDDRILGRTIELDGTAFTVVGIMPAEFDYPAGTELWTSLTFTSADANSGAQRYWAIGRLRPGVTLEGARAELRVLMQEQQLHDPVANGGHSATAFSFEEMQRTVSRSTPLLLGGVAGAMLLIVLANLQALAVVRTLRRSSAMAVRAALGASRWQLARQLLVESLLLSMLGGALGLLLASWGADVASALMQRWFNLSLVLHVDARVFGMTCALVVAAAVLIAAAPILQIFSADLRNALHDGGITASGSRRQRRLREAAVGIQLAMTLTLLGAAGTLVKSFLYLQHFDVGYDADHLLVATLDFQGTRYANADQARVLGRRLLDRFSALAGGRDVAVWRTLSPGMMVRPGEDYATIEGQPEGFSRYCRGVATCRIPVSTEDVSSEFFTVAGIPIIRGRAFTTEDGPGAPPVAIVTETTAQRWWPGEDAIGKRFKIGGVTSPYPWMTVIGVTSNVREVNEWGLSGSEVRFGHDYFPGFFRPLAQTNPVSRGRPVWTSSLILGIHTLGDPQALVANVRRELTSLAPDLPIGTVQSLRQLMLDGGTNAQLQLNAHIMIGVSAVAVILAILGLYGVVADAVRSRTKEIAIRMALGARSAHVLTTVTRTGIVTGCAGILAGCVLSRLFRDPIARAFFGATEHFKPGYLVGVSPGDPLAIATAAVVLLCVIAAASYLTARRATRVDPAAVLRAE